MTGVQTCALPIFAAIGIQFYGGIGSPLGAFIGYTTGVKFSWLIWIIVIFFASFVNAFLYKLILSRKRVKNNNEK